jgi:hypothetical protein
LRGVDPTGIAEVVQVARFGADALNLVIRVNGRVGERLVYRGEESSFDLLEAGRSYAFDADGNLMRLASEAYRSGLPTFSIHISPSVPPRLKRCPTRSRPFTAKCCRASRCGSC